MHYPLIPWSFANIYKLKLLIMFLSAIFDRKVEMLFLLERL